MRLIAFILVYSVLVLSGPLRAQGGTQVQYNFVGDTVKFSAALYNEKKEMTVINFPAGVPLVLYRFKWKDNDSKHQNETEDSVKLLLSRIKDYLNKNQISKARLMFVSHDKDSVLDDWVKKVSEIRSVCSDTGLEIIFVNTGGIRESEVKLKSLMSKVTFLNSAGQIIRYWSRLSKI